MKKKLLICAMAMVVLMSLVLVSCGKEDEAKAPGVPTNVKVESADVVWDAVSGAKSYTVMVNSGEVTGITETRLKLTEGKAAEFIVEGVNSVKVRAVSGELKSDYSAAVTYTHAVVQEKLATPVIAFDGVNAERVTWGAIANASGYRVNIDGADKIGKVTNTYYDFAPNVTAATIKIMAVGEGKYTNSDYSNTLEYENEAPQAVKLATPEVTAEKKVISWADVPYAESYALSVDGGEYSAATSPYTLAATEVGDHIVKVKAIGDGVMYTDSDEGQVTVSIAKLKTPILSASGRTLSWAAIEGATKYFTKVNDGEWQPCLGTSYTLEKQTSAGDYQVSVKATGEEGDETVVESEVAVQSITFTKLATPSALVYTNDGYLQWTCAGATKFEITVQKDGAPLEIKNVTTDTGKQRFAYTAAGEYSFAIKAVALGELEIDGDSTEIVATVAAKVKLATPVLTLNNVTKTVSWAAVANAEKYKVAVKKGSGAFVETETTQLSFTLTDTDIEKYEIKVMAMPAADSQTHLPGDYSAVQTIKITGALAVPVIAADGTQKNKLVWAAVPFATGYEIYKAGAKIDTVSVCEYVVRGEGEHRITVKAVSTNELYTASALSSEISVTIQKLSITLSVSGRTVSWGANPNATGYEYKIDSGAWTTVAGTSFEIPATVGAYTVYVKALGDGQIFINSDEVRTSVTVVQLAVENISSNGKTVNWTANANANFEVSLDGIEYVSVSGNSYTLAASSAGNYTVYVRAQGKNTAYLQSAAVSVDITVTQLSTPSALAYDTTSGILSWTGSGSSYLISVTKDGTTTTFNASSTSYNLSLSDAATYSITVKALSNDGNVLVLDSDNSDALEVIVTEAVTKLDTPLNVAIEGAVITWDAVSNATSYEVAVSGSTTASYTVTECTYTLVLGAGNYTVKVRAMADGIASSEFTTGSAYVVTEKLGGSTITQNGSAISWSQVPNATGYRVAYTVNGTETVIALDTTETSYTFEGLSAPLLAKFAVTARGDGSIYLDGDVSEKNIIIRFKHTAPALTKNEILRVITVAAKEGAAIKYRYYAAGTAAGEYIAYPAGGIPYGNTAGEFTLDVKYVGSVESGWDDSDVVTKNYTLLAAPTDIVIDKDTIAFKANEQATGFMIRDNGGGLAALNAGMTLGAGMHRFYISATGGENVLRSDEKYYTVLMISTVADFNLLTVAYDNSDGFGSANNMWGTASLINDIANPAGILEVKLATLNYNGNFQGNNYTIGSVATPLTVANLFGKNCGSIRDLKLIVDITSTDDYVGGLVSENWFRVGSDSVATSATLRNVTVSGTVRGKNFVGGIAGANMGNIISCVNNATVVASAQSVGGITGDNKAHTLSGVTKKGYINNAVNNGTVTGTAYVGGIAGKLSANGIDGAYNTGRIDGTAGAWAVGGIAGFTEHDTVVFNCLNEGEIGLADNSYDVGGIVGKMSSDSKPGASGWGNSGMINCINVGKINTAKTNDQSKKAGGFLIGQTYSWDIVGTNIWSTRGVKNCVYLTGNAGVTVAVGVSNNGGLKTDAKAMASNLDETAANALCATLNANDLTDGDVFKVVSTDDISFRITLVWVDALSRV